MNWKLRSAAAMAACVVSSGAFAGGPLTGEVVLGEGDAVGAQTATSVNGVFVTPSGTVGFNGGTASGDNFVWVGTGPAVFNSDFKQVVTGAEAPTGVADDGNYIYSPAVDGLDSVVFGDGFIVSETQPSYDGVPGFITFNSRPFMTPGGVGYWISGYNQSDPNGSTQARVVYRYDGTAVTAVTVAGDGFTYEGESFNIAGFGGIDFDFHVSAGDVNRIQIADADGVPTGVNTFLFINGQAIHREGDPNGTGDNWDNFDLVRILDDGTYVMTGDTDGDSASDEFIAVNGLIAIREGMTIDGVTIASGSTLRGIDLADDGTLLHVWGGSSLDEVAFLGNVADLAGTSTRLLGVGDTIELVGRGPATIADLTGSTVLPGGYAISDAAVFVNMDVTPTDGGATYEAIVRFERGGATPCPGDLDGNGEVGFDDLLAVLAAFGTTSPDGDANGDGAVDFDDLLLVLAAFGPCP